MTKEQEAFERGRKSGMASANAKNRKKKKTTRRKSAIGATALLAVLAAGQELSGGSQFKGELPRQARIAVKSLMLQLGIPTINTVMNGIAILITAFGLKRIMNEMRLNPELFRVGGRIFKAF